GCGRTIVRASPGRRPGPSPPRGDAGRAGRADDRAMADRQPEIARSPADILRLVVAVAVLAVLLLVEALFGRSIAEFSSDVLSGLGAVATWLATAAVVVVRGGTLLLVVAGLVAVIA